MDISPELKGTSIFLVGKNSLILGDACQPLKCHVDSCIYVLI